MVCSFVFLLVGLAALSSSINLLVLRFMILSLEEDETDDGGDAAGANNIVNLDGEILGMNGRVLTGGGHLVATSERNLVAAVAREADTASVCSCTCYGGQSKSSRNGGGGSGNNPPQGKRGWREQKRVLKKELVTTEDGEEVIEVVRSVEPQGTSSRLLWCAGKIFGCRESMHNLDGENFYDEETQSISNYTRFAVKRASF